ncbi:hypothetical protein PN451_18030 [Dolichospermum planctonicum CS-1226]|uniref:Uncharacterized protein n=1 Tax=Dolichospermum planctonicum CS-1226 TaxID=3021751 RepID=A0ABT5ALB8_9CYAN|nr:hypothetical protein [Dolichospermum planctonicum]MDB9537707.1 hypothetical protein [Dolichospermum planctonicum CS-1226]
MRNIKIFEGEMAYRDFKLPELVKKFGLTINERKEGDKINLINGIVTTGNMWKFLQLQDQVVYIDFNEYYKISKKYWVSCLRQLIKHSG